MAITAAGCEWPGSAESEADNVNTSTGTAADNTGRNERDRDLDTLTPEDQSESEEDRTITQRVRQGVVGEYGATAAAANVTIVTVDRVVTLRGPVNSESEQSTIGTIARNVEGVSRVDNQLEIASE